MSYERWIRCDACGNSLLLKDRDTEMPEGWFAIERQEKPEPEVESEERYGGLIIWTEEPRRPRKHICSASCLEKLGLLERENA